MLALSQKANGTQRTIASGGSLDQERANWFTNIYKGYAPPVVAQDREYWPECVKIIRDYFVMGGNSASWISACKDHRDRRASIYSLLSTYERIEGDRLSALDSAETFRQGEINMHISEEESKEVANMFAEFRRKYAINGPMSTRRRAADILRALNVSEERLVPF